MTGPSTVEPAVTEPVVAIYGLGGIGVRHVQGLAPLRHKIRLFGVDPLPEARRRARDAWAAVGAAGDFVAPDDAADRPADLVILATSARGRLELLQSALRRHRPRHVIVEKVVFQQIEDFDAARSALAEADARAFVNCPRRLWPLHRWLATDLAARGPFQMRMNGLDWGLGSNSVHMLDLFQMLTGRAEIAPVAGDVASIMPSKRAGYFEVLGELTFRSADGSTLTVAAGHRHADHAGLEIVGDGWRRRIDEAAGDVWDESGARIAALGRSPYQSELTHLAVKPLLEGGDCGLADLSESRLAHAPFLEILSQGFARHDVSTTAGVPVS